MINVRQKQRMRQARDIRSDDPVAMTGLARSWLRSVGPLAQAMVTRHVHFHGLQVDIPFPAQFRLSMVAGNIRVQRLIDALIRPGDRVVDVGAHIGLNALYMAARVGPAGRVTAIEPALDNLAVLRRNISVNRLENVTVWLSLPAGRTNAATSSCGVR